MEEMLCHSVFETPGLLDVLGLPLHLLAALALLFSALTEVAGASGI